MFFSMLQRDALCCSVLQCFAVCCSLLQYVAVHCSALQCDAVCCSVLQLNVAEVCSLKACATGRTFFSVLQCVAVLQYVAVC